MTERAEFFPVSGARYELEDLLKKVDKSNWVSEKWKLLMQMYPKHLAFEHTHKLALDHAKTYEDRNLPQSDSSTGLNEALKAYREKIPVIEEEYKKAQVREALYFIEWTVPNERMLKLEDSLEERKKFFEGDWGALKAIEREIEQTEQRITQINRSKMNPIEMRVELEINNICLGKLKSALAQVKKLYTTYITNFRTYSIM